MIYILTEDSGNGFEFCRLIKELYFDVKSININLDTLNGIWGLKQKIEEKVKLLGKNDTIIVVYDDIVENPIISHNINQAIEYIDKNNLNSKVLWVSTYSFEIELLLVVGFELFANSSKYNKYFGKLRSKFLETNSLFELTTISKKDPLYSSMYNQARNSKKKVKMYTRLGSADFEKAITIETISKDIMKEVFKYDSPLKASDFVDRPIGVKDPHNCWKNNCCSKKDRCKNEGLDIDRIIQKQQGEDKYKTKFLILNTSYHKLIEEVYKLEGITMNIQNISIGEFYTENALKANYVHKKYGGMV